MRRIVEKTPILWTGLVACLWGCGDQSEAVAVTEVDSAGVRIVTSVGVRVLDSAWSVSTVPRLEVGSVDGPEATRFFSVADAVRLPGGGFAVADGGSEEIRVFDADGVHVITFGGRGDGPEEFQRLSTLSLTTDGTLVAYDRGRTRASELSMDGTMVGATTVGLREIDGVPALPTGLVTTPAGWLVGRGGVDLAGGQGIGLTQDTAAWIRIDRESGDHQVIARVPGAWSVRFEIQGSGGFRTAPLTALPSWDVSTNDLAFTSGEKFEVRLADVTGGLREVWRRAEPQPAVTPDVIQAWEEDLQRVTEIPDSEAAFMREFFDAMPYPDSLPAYSELKVDPSGYVWAERFGAFEPSGEWDVYSDEGSFMGTVTLPVALRVLEIGRDFILGVRRDELGVEYVQEFELVRPAR